MTDATKIIIAQRITSVMDTDQIIILDDGRIHGTGTHRELLEKDSIYQEIYASQMKRRGGLMAKRQITGKKPKNSAILWKLCCPIWAAISSFCCGWQCW